MPKLTKKVICYECRDGGNDLDYRKASLFLISLFWEIIEIESYMYINLALSV